MGHREQQRDLVRGVISFEEPSEGLLEMYSGDIKLLHAKMYGVSVEVAKRELMAEFFGFKHISIN